MSKRVILISTLCGLVTGVLCGLCWYEVSDVNWLDIPAVPIFFIINACVGGVLSAAFFKAFRRAHLGFSLYLGQTLLIAVGLLIYLFTEDPSTEGWGWIFLIGWIVISAIPTSIARFLMKRYSKWYNSQLLK